MEHIPQDLKPIMMLFDGEWQKAVEVPDEETPSQRWFKGDSIGFIPINEIQDWKAIINTSIVAAWCGTGKTYYHDKINSDSIEIEYWKYKDNDLKHCYISDVKSQIGNVDFIFISTDPDGLRLLHEHGLEITLVYPQNELRNEYLDRYIERDSPYDFIGTFMKHWNIWIDELKEQKYCNHAILNSGQYLSDVISNLSVDPD